MEFSLPFFPYLTPLALVSPQITKNPSGKEIPFAFAFVCAECERALRNLIFPLHYIITFMGVGGMLIGNDTVDETCS